MATNHYADPITPGGVHGTTRNAGGASSAVQQTIVNEIINQARNTFHLGNQDVANLLAIGKLESGFNPDAAAKSILQPGASADRETSAAGVFQVTDSTAADALKRLSNTATDDNVTLGAYDRFDYVSNIQYGIAVYLDKKRVANSSDVFNIYKAWNTNPNEYNRYQTSLRNDEATYAQQISTSSATPGAAEAADTDTLNTDRVYVYAPQGFLTLTQELQLQPNFMDPAVQETIGYDHFYQEWLNTTRTITNPDGTKSVEYIGHMNSGDQLNVQNATVTVDPNSSATINGTGLTLIVGDFADASVLGAGTVVAGRGDDISTYSDNTHVIIHGDSTRVYNYGANDTTIMSAGNDISVNHGYNDITNSYGPADDTYDYGYDERDHNFGPNDFGWAANASDIVYNANPSDTSAGYGDIRVHGNARVPGDGYYGYYGFAGNSAANDATHGSNIGSLAQFDRVHGKSGEAAVAQRAKSEIDDAIAHDAKVMLSGAKWEKNTVTWSVGDGGDFSGSMSPSEVQAVKQAFADWSAATGLNFVEVASSGTADITVGMGSFDTSNTGVIGFTTFRATGGEIQPGAVVRVEDVSEDPLVSGADGTSVYGGTDATFSQALLHEIGHALGFGDNADPTSVESYYLSAANRTLSSHDIAQAAALYGGGSAAVHDAHQIIQAMSSFAPAPMVSSVAANDPSVSVNAVLYGGNQLMQRANAN